MTLERDPSADRGGYRELAGLLRAVSYEVFPSASTMRDVLAEVPATIPLSVTATQGKGLEATLDLTESLLRNHYTVTPHLPARLFADRHHVEDVVARLNDSGATSVFVVGGDSPKPEGAYADAHSLLLALEEAGHSFTEVGIAGYPEGHALIGSEELDRALERKAPLATYAVTQICFDAKATARWTERITGSDAELPVRVGMPGPVNRHKLMRIGAGLGLGQSARFLRKQPTLVRRLLRPRGYDPTAFARRLEREITRTRTGIHGLHIYTFNDLRRTENWRRRLTAPTNQGG